MRSEWGLTFSGADKSMRGELTGEMDTLRILRVLPEGFSEDMFGVRDKFGSPRVELFVGEVRELFDPTDRLRA